jgi:hypothetical protein
LAVVWSVESVDVVEAVLVVELLELVPELLSVFDAASV